jgi:hypothetical protein
LQALGWVAHAWGAETATAGQIHTQTATGGNAQGALAFVHGALPVCGLDFNATSGASSATQAAPGRVGTPVKGGR